MIPLSDSGLQEIYMGTLWFISLEKTNPLYNFPTQAVSAFSVSKNPKFRLK